MFESQLIAILVEKIQNFQKKDLEKGKATYKIQGNFLGRGWELNLPLCPNVKVSEMVGYGPVIGYLFSPQYTSQSFRIITDLVELDLDNIPKDILLKYSSFKYPIMYNNHIMDLGDYILNDTFDYGSLRLIHYAADNSHLEIEIKRNFDLFIQNIVPNIHDLMVEFGDSVENGEGSYEVCNVLDRKSEVFHYESIGFLKIQLPDQIETISENAFNYFKSGLIYQIEVLLKAENLDLKIELKKDRNALYGIEKEVVMIYYPIRKTPILPQGFQGYQGLNNPTFSTYGATGFGHTPFSL